MIYVGDKKLKSSYLGNEKIRKVYRGDDLVFVPVPTYTITASIAPDGSGTVSGAGTYQEGQTVTLTAAPGTGYKFAAWRENGETVSEEESYTFTVDGDRTLLAVFEEIPVERTISVTLTTGSSLGVGKMFSSYAVATIGGIRVAPPTSSTANTYTQSIVTTQNPIEVSYRVTTTKFISTIYIYVNGTRIGIVQASGTTASTTVPPGNGITLKAN